MDPQRGKPYCRNRFLEYGVAGAVLAELEFRGRISEQLAGYG
ncbi:GPP34 family phosphoprotein [Streptomyces sp. NBC_01618]|nr:GPP34 family phosphoprotein [Streptomyces sp. NBC_01618]